MIPTEVNIQHTPTTLAALAADALAIAGFAGSDFYVSTCRFDGRPAIAITRPILTREQAVTVAAAFGVSDPAAHQFQGAPAAVLEITLPGSIEVAIHYAQVTL